MEQKLEKKIDRLKRVYNALRSELGLVEVTCYKNSLWRDFMKGESHDTLA